MGKSQKANQHTQRLLVISKVVVESPFGKWKGKLKHLWGRRSDELVKEARGHDHSDCG